MIEVVRIAHPLREITLEYDRSKPELECEKELVGMLILKHDYWHEIQSEQGKLLYDIGEVENEVDVEAIRFNALEAAMLHKHQEIKIYTGDKKNEELVAEAREGFFELLGRMTTERRHWVRHSMNFKRNSVASMQSTALIMMNMPINIWRYPTTLKPARWIW